MPKSASPTSPTPAKTRKKRAKAKPASATDSLLAVLVVDESSSMASTIGTEVVIEETDAYVKGLAEDAVEAESPTFVSLTKFSSGGAPFTHLEVAAPVENVKPLAGRYQPNGMTALFDAIAHSLEEADRALREMGQPEMKCLHVTFTDGGENASRDYPAQGYPPTNPDLVRLVHEYEYLTPDERTLDAATKASLLHERVAEGDPRGNWTFVALLGGAATQADAVNTAVSMGYFAGNAVAASATAGGYKQSTSSLRSATSARRSGESISSSSFFADAGQTSADYGVGDDTTSENAGGTTSVAAQPGDVAKATGLTKSDLSDLLGGK